MYYPAGLHLSVTLYISSEYEAFPRRGEARRSLRLGRERKFMYADCLCLRIHVKLMHLQE